MGKHSFVMLVDGDRSILNTVKRILELEGETVFSSNVREVLANLGAFRPNLVIVDLETPDLASPSVAEISRCESGAPVLMLTTRCEVTTLREALAVCTSRGGGKPLTQELPASLFSKLRRTGFGTIAEN